MTIRYDVMTVLALYFLYQLSYRASHEPGVACQQRDGFSFTPLYFRAIILRKLATPASIFQKHAHAWLPAVLKVNVFSSTPQEEARLGP